MVKEVKGRAGKLIGNLVTPSSDIVQLQLAGDILRVQQKSRFFSVEGLDEHESWIRLQNIDSVTVGSGPIWWLLWLGIALLPLWLIGILFIIAFAIIKQNWLIIHSHRQSVVLFFKKKERDRVQQFAQTVLMASRQASNPQRPSPSNHRPPQRKDSR